MVGKATARFTNGRHLIGNLKSSNITATNCFMVIVGMLNTKVYNDEWVASIADRNSGTYDFNSASYAVTFFRASAAINALKGWRNSTQYTASPTIGVGTNFFAVSAFDGVNHKMFLNGTVVSTNASTGSFNAGQIRIAYFGPGGGFAGNLSEVIVGDTALDSDTRQKLEGYIAWKYGLQGLLPATHAYYGAAP
jgi:hypothetical protein